MAHHNLKAHPDSFELLALRVSGVQLRKNDRDFRVGDTCTFYEWDPVRERYTGQTVPNVPVTTMLDKHDGLTPGWCLIVLDLPDTSIRRFNPALAGALELPKPPVPVAELPDAGNPPHLGGARPRRDTV